jgi:hypothetical protein
MRAELLSTGRLVEVACDESGAEGQKLIGGNTDVFAHASVELDVDTAAGCVQELRNRIRSPAEEYKANHLLRGKHREVLKWLLSPQGPIYGHAHVHLIDKTFFAVGKAVDLLLGEIAYVADIGLHQDRQARAMAVTMYREGPRAFGRAHWTAFLESFNDMMRGRTSVDSFYRTVEILRLGGTRGPVDGIMGLLWTARPHVDDFRARLLDNPRVFPALDPMFPAIVRTIVRWGTSGRPVSVVHDRQTALADERIAQLKEVFSKPHPALLRYSPRVRLTGLRLVESRSDPRVQVADYLAGTARKIASDELNGDGDAELTALLRPYVDPSSIWGDDRSWALLDGARRA